MKGSVKEMYDSMKMPEDLENRIQHAVKPAAAPRRRSLLRTALATAAVLALTLCLVPPVRAAVGNFVTKLFPEIGLTVYEKELSNGGRGQIVHYDTDGPAFAEVQDGRLYFTGDGQDLDITDLVQNNQPYIYTTKDDKGNTIYMAVGIADTVENFGIYSFIQDASGQWITGAGQNFLSPDVNQPYPWVENLWQTLNLPWPIS